MKKIIHTLAAIVICMNTIAQIPDPCTGAAAAQVVDGASPCNCSEAQAGTSCNKSVFATKNAADMAINFFLVNQFGYGQPTTPTNWQDVRTSNLMVNAVIKHEFSTEYTTGPSTFLLSAINICQVKSTCNAVCQGYKIILKTGGTCGINAIVPTLVVSALDANVFYRQYAVSPNTTYIISRQIFYDFNTGGCSTSWTGSDGSPSGGAKITSQHWFIWEGTGVVATNDFNLYAKQINNKVMLQWNEPQSSNYAKFEIEKSIDATNFTKIGEVLSKGNATVKNNYWIEDNQPNATNYYRVKTIATDGKISFSPIVELVLKTNTNTSIIIAPNPVQETANIILESKIATTVSYKILSTIGNIVAAGNMQLQKGINKISKNVAMLASGTYLFVSEINGERVGVKFVKN